MSEHHIYPSDVLPGTLVCTAPFDPFHKANIGIVVAVRPAVTDRIYWFMVLAPGPQLRCWSFFDTTKVHVPGAL